MRTVLYLLMFAFTISVVNAQDIIDPPTLPINFNNTAVFDRNFNQTHFVKGWNWGGTGRKLDEAMLMNYYHCGFQFDLNANNYNDTSLFIHNHRRVLQLNGITGGRGENCLLNAHSEIIFPYITIDSTNAFQPRAYDSSGAVFGFTFKNKVRILDSSQHTNVDYNYVLLDKDSVQGTPVMVLEKSCRIMI